MDKYTLQFIISKAVAEDLVVILAKTDLRKTKSPGMLDFYRNLKEELVGIARDEEHRVFEGE